MVSLKYTVTSHCVTFLVRSISGLAVGVFFSSFCLVFTVWTYVGMKVGLHFISDGTDTIFKGFYGIVAF